jgi:hypothetical protein
VCVVFSGFGAAALAVCGGGVLSCCAAFPAGRAVLAFSEALGGRGTSLRGAAVLFSAALGRGALFAACAATARLLAELWHSCLQAYKALLVVWPVQRRGR